jgi:hypothetical protein
MDREAVRTYARRDWAAVQRLRLRERGEKFRKEGPSGMIRASRALWSFVRAARRNWPSARERTEDLAHHVELKRRLDRAARAFPVR